MVKRNGYRLPDKPELFVTEVARLLAPRLQISEHAARARLYRRIETGEVKAIRVVGTLMIPRAEAQRVLDGEPT